MHLNQMLSPYISQSIIQIDRKFIDKLRNGDINLFVAPLFCDAQPIGSIERS